MFILHTHPPLLSSSTSVWTVVVKGALYGMQIIEDVVYSFLVQPRGVCLSLVQLEEGTTAELLA